MSTSATQAVSLAPAASVNDPYIVRFNSPSSSGFSLYNMMRRTPLEPFIGSFNGKELLVIRAEDGAGQIAQIDPASEEGVQLLASKTDAFKHRVAIRDDRFQVVSNSRAINMVMKNEELLKIIEEIRHQILASAPKVAARDDASPGSVPESAQQSMDGSFVITPPASTTASASSSLAPSNSSSAANVTSSSVVVPQTASASSSVSCVSSSMAALSQENATANFFASQTAKLHALNAKVETLEKTVNHLSPRVQRTEKKVDELVEQKDAASSLSGDQNEAPVRFAGIRAFWGRMRSGVANWGNRTVVGIRGTYTFIKDNFLTPKDFAAYTVIVVGSFVLWAAKHNFWGRL